MCRLLAVEHVDAEVTRHVLSAFRNQAAGSATGPPDHRVHPDGWGIVARTGRGLEHLGRGPADAARDPAYERAVARVEEAQPGTWVLAHVRNASVGARGVENSHPFVRDGWAFAHNGTIHGLQPPADARPAGDTDSERFFLHILGEPNGPRPEALAAVTRRIATSHHHSSLTCLLTNGRTLIAQRHVGPDPGGCGTRACALEYYGLGEGTFRGARVVTQETGFLPGITAWREFHHGERGSFEARTVERLLR